eukprot:5179889-Heterocapsa_arctica.AAC.1
MDTGIGPTGDGLPDTLHTTGGHTDGHAPTTPLAVPHPEPDETGDPESAVEAVPAPPAQVVQAGGPSGRRARKMAREEQLRLDASSTRHLMTHFPFNP